MAPQLSLFSENNPTASIEVAGLRTIPDFISRVEADRLLNYIDQQPWLGELKRRVQHYGYRYDYRARTVSRELYLGPLPEWLQEYCQKLYNQQLFQKVPDQVIINEYQAGQGISSHIDCIPCFGETIASLSLGSACVMDFSHKTTRAKTSRLLQPQSLLILSGEAR